MVATKRISVKAGKVAETYGQLSSAWRVGTVQDFRYGTRSDTDPTLVWLVDGVEYAKTDHAGVRGQVAEGLERAGVRSVTVGLAWCGYPSLTVEYESGTVSHESYDGHGLVVESTASAFAEAA